MPHEWFTYLRRNAPVYKHPEPDGPGFWVITRHADVCAVGKDAGDVLVGPGAGRRRRPRGGAGARGVPGAGKLMLTMDPPDHTRYRKLVNKGFTPRMIGALEPRIRAVCERIVDDVVAKGGCDFVVDVAAEITSRPSPS